MNNRDNKKEDKRDIDKCYRRRICLQTCSEKPDLKIEEIINKFQSDLWTVTITEKRNPGVQCVYIERSGEIIKICTG